MWDVSTTQCILLFLFSWKPRGYFERNTTSHRFKAVHHYHSSVSCSGRLLLQLVALKIESLLCVDAEGRERQRSFSATSALLKSQHQWDGKGKKRIYKRVGKKKKRRHEEVVLTLFVFNAGMLKKAACSAVVVVRRTCKVQDVRSFSLRSLTWKK